MKHVLFKIKKNKESDWRKWCGYLRAHEIESKETMKAENSVYERCLIYERDGEYYVVGTALFEGEPKKADLNVELNKLHLQAKKESLSSPIAVFSGDFKPPQEHEILYEFDLR